MKHFITQRLKDHSRYNSGNESLICCFCLKKKKPYILGFGIKSIVWVLPQLLSDKEFSFNGEVGLIPELGIFPGGGNGNPLQYSCLENPMDRGTWRATVCKVHDLATKQ